MGEAPADRPNFKERLADPLREWTGAVAKRGVTLCIKTNLGGAVTHTRSTAWLHGKAASPFLKMTYDFSQFRLSGLAPDATMKQLLGDTRPVHLQNVVGTTMFAEVSLSGLGGGASAQRFKPVLVTRHSRSPSLF